MISKIPNTTNTKNSFKKSPNICFEFLWRSNFCPKIPAVNFPSTVKIVRSVSISSTCSIRWLFGHSVTLLDIHCAGASGPSQSICELQEGGQKMVQYSKEICLGGGIKTCKIIDFFLIFSDFFKNFFLNFVTIIFQDFFHLLLKISSTNIFMK